MSAPLSPGAALRTIPGWEQASWRPMSGGLTNRAWVVESDGQRGVLKIDAARRGVPFGDRRYEARVQGIAAAAGLANPVLFASETIYLTAYVEGTVWNPRRFTDDGELTRLAYALRRVHSLPRIGRVFDAAAAARHYCATIGGADAPIALHHVDVIKSMPPPERMCCCHNDVVAENILDAEGLRFLDWEYAADNDPMFDLAIVIAHHDLSDSQASLLLDAYCEGDGAGRRAQLHEQINLYEALCWLWGKSRP